MTKDHASEFYASCRILGIPDDHARRMWWQYTHPGLSAKYELTH